MNAGLLPVRRFQDAKQRLAPDFDPPARAEIARALFADALELCARVDFLRWWVVSDDADVLAVAAERGHDTVRDDGTGLNEAVALAVADIVARGADSIAIVPSDVPLARPPDIQDLVDTGATSDVVLVPSGEDSGTNGLCLRPPDVISPRFGPASLAAHALAAAERGLRCSLLPLERLALDIDTIADVDAFLRRSEEGTTAEVLRRLRGG
ncbi:MAG: 2-phospho-L-lactate guanylyltransferase [Actinomycetota bacterium]